MKRSCLPIKRLLVKTLDGLVKLLGLRYTEKKARTDIVEHTRNEEIVLSHGIHVYTYVATIVTCMHTDKKPIDSHT